MMVERQDDGAVPPGRLDPMAIVAMLSGACTVGLVFTVLPPILHPLAAHLGGGDAVFGVQMMAAMPGLGLMMGGVASSWTIDRIGARALLLSALLGYMLVGSAGLYVDDMVLLSTSRFLLGLAAACIATASNTLIGHYFEGKARGRMTSAVTVIGSLVSVVAMLASGEIAEAVGWRASFALYIAIPLVVWVAGMAGLPRTRVADGQAPDGMAGGTLAVLRGLWPYYLMITSLYVVLMMTSTQASFLLAENGMSRPAIQARVLGTGGAFLVVGAVLYAWVQARFSASAAFRLGLLLLGIGIVGFGLAHDPVTASIAAAFKGLASGLLNTGFIHMVMNRADAHQRGRALGLMTSAMFLGDFINPIVVHPIKELFGLAAAFHILGTLVLAGLLWSLTKPGDPSRPVVTGRV